MRLAAVAEDERNTELELAGIRDPNKLSKKFTKANELLKKLQGAAPADSSKVAN